MSLLETDCDVVDYLLRRKASQNLWDSTNLRTKSLKWAVNLHVLTSGSTCLLLSCQRAEWSPGGRALLCECPSERATLIQWFHQSVEWRRVSLWQQLPCAVGWTDGEMPRGRRRVLPQTIFPGSVYRRFPQELSCTGHRQRYITLFDWWIQTTKITIQTTQIKSPWFFCSCQRPQRIISGTPGRISSARTLRTLIWLVIESALLRLTLRLHVMNAGFFNDIFFQAPLETWQNPSRADRRRGGAVTKVTTSCPALLKAHWVCWKSGHTSQWLAAAAVPTTTEDRHSRRGRCIRGWAANQEPSAWTTWQQWQDNHRVHYWRSGHMFCLITTERWRRPILLTPRPPSLHTSLPFKPRGRPTLQPPLGLDRLMVPVPQTGVRSAGTYGR